MTVKNLITFCETFYRSRNLLLNKFPVVGNADGSINIYLDKDGESISLTYRGDILTFTYNNNNDYDSLKWTVTYDANQIIIKHDDVGDHGECESYQIYSMTISMGEVDTTHFKNTFYSDWGSNHKDEGPLSIPGQEELLNKLVKLIKNSTPAVEVAMAEYYYKLQATPIIHNFFKEIKTGSVPSTDKGVENLILSYL